MTIEQIIGMSASELEAMTPEQLHEYFSPFFAITRPEQQARAKVGESVSLQTNEKFNEARRMAATLGIVIPELPFTGKLKKKKP